MLLADEWGGDTLFGECDESEVAPGVRDKNVHHVPEAVEMLNEILLGQGLKEIWGELNNWLYDQFKKYNL